MKTPHKHAELIKAWADGAEIEVKDSNGIWDKVHTPTWGIPSEYRIKPEPKPDVVMYGNPAIDDYGHLTYAQWPCDNLKLTFDGTTNKLIKAEVI